MIITHVDKKLSVDGYKALNKEDSELLEFMSRFPKVIIGSFQTDDDDEIDVLLQKNKRIPFHTEIKADLDHCTKSDKIYMEVFNFKSFCQKIANFFHFLFVESDKKKIRYLFEKDRLGMYQQDSICLEVVLNDIFITECGHVFHFDCLALWIQHGNNTCPNCRQPLKEFVRLKKKDEKAKEDAKHKEEAEL